MPGFVKLIAELNRQFHPDHINDFAKHAGAFASGKRLDAGLIAKPGSPVQRRFSSFLNQLLGSLHESLRGVIHHALSSKPPVQVTFAWAPAYDYEMTIWPTDCGITVLFKSRYPADKPPPTGDDAA